MLDRRRCRKLSAISDIFFSFSFPPSRRRKLNRHFILVKGANPLGLRPGEISDATPGKWAEPDGLKLAGKKETSSLEATEKTSRSVLLRGIRTRRRKAAVEPVRKPRNYN